MKPRAAGRRPKMAKARHGAPPRSAPAKGRASGSSPDPLLAEFGADRAYKRSRLPASEVRDYEGRYELWDRASETALMVREPSPFHELPAEVLAALVERIATVRGRPIRCYGSMNLAVLDGDGRPKRIMQADQSLYLHPERANIVGRFAMVVGRNHYPDVVLEVDRSTDVRRHKLKLYEAWGFPEVWVEVPDESPRPRAKRGTTIHVLQGDAYAAVPESPAFLGWTAAEIHAALNEPRLSAATVAVLERVGAALGQSEGTGPDDDPMLGPQRRRLREDVRQEMLAEELERRGRMIGRLVRSRGVAVAEHFPMQVPGFAAARVEAAVDAALACKDAADFAARLRGEEGG